MPINFKNNLGGKTLRILLIFLSWNSLGEQQSDGNNQQDGENNQQDGEIFTSLHKHDMSWVGKGLKESTRVEKQVTNEILL